MPATTNPTRTTSVIGNETRSGVRCSDCGTTYATCTAVVLGSRAGRACCGDCQTHDTHDVEVVESPPPPTTPTPELREVRQNARRVIHKTTTMTGRTDITTLCSERIPRTSENARQWMGGEPPDFTECPVCFAPEPPVIREVRTSGVSMIHRTAHPHGEGAARPVALCGVPILRPVREARTWSGGADTDLTECPTCFPPEVEVVVDDPAAVEVRANANPVVHLTHDGTAQPNTLCGERLSYKVRDPRRWNGHPVRPITDCPECFAMQPRIPEQPVPEVLHDAEPVRAQRPHR